MSGKMMEPLSPFKTPSLLPTPSFQSECANYIKLVQQYDSNHLLACGTGAFNPVCTHLKKGHWHEVRHP